MFLYCIYNMPFILKTNLKENNVTNKLKKYYKIIIAVFFQMVLVWMFYSAKVPTEDFGLLDKPEIGNLDY